MKQKVKNYTSYTCSNCTHNVMNDLDLSIRNNFFCFSCGGITCEKVYKFSNI